MKGQQWSKSVNLENCSLSPYVNMGNLEGSYLWHVDNPYWVYDSCCFRGDRRSFRITWSQNEYIMNLLALITHHSDSSKAGGGFVRYVYCHINLCQSSSQGTRKATFWKVIVQKKVDRWGRSIQCACFWKNGWPASRCHHRHLPT